ncbi:hypothetical protein Tco_0306620, partial [Tanacetum coccineum]
RLPLTAPRPGCEVGEIFAAAAPRQPRADDGRLRVGQLEGQLPAVRVEIEVLRRERLAYEQESIQTRQDLARSEAYSRVLEAGARDDTLEDTGSSA